MLKVLYKLRTEYHFESSYEFQFMKLWHDNHQVDQLFEMVELITTKKHTFKQQLVSWNIEHNMLFSYGSKTVVRK